LLTEPNAKQTVRWRLFNTPSAQDISTFAFL